MIRSILIMVTFCIITLVSPPIALVLVLLWLINSKPVKKCEAPYKVEPPEQEVPARQKPNLYVVK